MDDNEVEKQEHTDRESSGIEQKLFDAWIEGNNLLPQSGDAILICMIDELASSETDWDSFANSHLSSEQIQIAGDEMTKGHRELSIKWAAAHSAQKGEMKVQPKILARIWEGAKANVWRVSASYPGYCQTGVVPEDASYSDINVREAIRVAKSFFTKPENSTEIEFLKQVAHTARNLFNEPELSSLSEDYRIALAAYHEKKRLKDPDEGKSFEEMVMAQENVRKTIVSEVARKFPDEEKRARTIVQDIFFA